MSLSICIDSQQLFHPVKDMKAQERDKLLKVLEARFDKNKHRHKGIAWNDVLAQLNGNRDALKAIHAMEESGGEPDVVGKDKKSGQYKFYDCSPETPAGRRSLCYDAEALDARKEHKPKGSAVAMAETMGIDLLTEEEYRELQKTGDFDTKTSSWIKTPADVRSLGGALFCDRRYEKVFMYHNGAQSYYASRGFRGKILV